MSLPSIAEVHEAITALGKKSTKTPEGFEKAFQAIIRDLYL